MNLITSLVIPPEDRATLEALARKHGYYQSRGVGAGSVGSISRLVCAIARGEVKLKMSKGKRIVARKLGYH